MAVIDVASARRRVQAHLQQLLGAVPGQDPTGNWVLPAGSARIMVNVAQPNPAAPPLVVVASPLLAQVQVSYELLAAINQLNAQLSFTRVYWLNGFVFASTELLAETVDAPELATVISQLAQVADAYDDQLRGRFGGLLPFAQGAAPVGPLGPQAVPVSDPGLPPPPPGAVSMSAPSPAATVPAAASPAGAGVAGTVPAGLSPIPPPPLGEQPTVTG